MNAASIQTAALLADLGATYARFAILQDGKIGVITTLNVRDFATPTDAIRAFLARPGAGPAPVKGVIAGAGPEVGGRLVMTNAPWTVDGAEIRDAFGWTSTVVLNDFAALAWSLPALAAADVRRIGGGTSVDGAPQAVIGAGTGFGVAGLIRGRQEEIVVVTEGGHATLAGETDREDAIIEILRHRFGHVSIERALSGAGLRSLCEAIAEVDGVTAPDGEAPEIVARALRGDCPASRATIELFCELLGSVAGNIALTLGARGGVFIAGGLAPRFLDLLVRSHFRERFEGKGRLKEYLAAVPTVVVTHPEPAFIGLARLAARQP